MSIAYTDASSGKTLVSLIVAGITPNEAAQSLARYLEIPFKDFKWRETTDAEAAELMQPTAEELRAAEKAVAKAEAATLLASRMQSQLAQTATFTAVEITTLARAGLFPEWAVGAKYAKGDRFVHGGIVYEVQQNVTAQGHQVPGSEGMLAVYRPLSVDGGTGEEPDGSREHPYAFIYGMDVHTGKYFTYEGLLYQAKGDMIPCVWNPGTAGLWQWELAG